MSIKNEFLIAWYDILWRNIDRSMTGMWHILAPITVVGTGLWALGEDYLPLWLGGSLVLLLIFWALNLTIDLNSWHRRNLYLLTAVERRFLDHEDYGQLVPAKYRTPRRSWLMFYRVHALTFGALLALTTAHLSYLCVTGDANCATWVVLATTFVGAAALTTTHFVYDRGSETEMHKELFDDTDLK